VVGRAWSSAVMRSQRSAADHRKSSSAQFRRTAPLDARACHEQYAHSRRSEQRLPPRPAATRSWASRGDLDRAHHARAHQPRRRGPGHLDPPPRSALALAAPARARRATGPLAATRRAAGTPSLTLTRPPARSVAYASRMASGIHAACAEGRVVDLQMFLESGTAVDDTGTEGATPLYVASRAGHTSTSRPFCWTAAPR